MMLKEIDIDVMYLEKGSHCGCPSVYCWGRSREVLVSTFFLPFPGYRICNTQLGPSSLPSCSPTLKYYRKAQSHSIFWMLVPRLVAHNVPFMPLLILLPFEYFMSVRNKRSWKFPGSPVVRALYFTAGRMGLIPGWGTKIPHAAEHGQKKKKNQFLG